MLDLLFVLAGLGVLEVEGVFYTYGLLDTSTGDELLVSDC